MKPFKGQVSQTTTHNKEYKIVTNDKICEPYWDEGWHYHKAYKAHRWAKRKKKVITATKVREYRSWKHNRKTQYKMKKIFDAH